VYGGFAIVGSELGIWLLFALYGIYAAMTEGVAKAWISDLVPTERRGLAIGLQTTLVSLAAMLASVWTGAFWNDHGMQLPLAVSAAMALVVAVGLAMWRKD